MTTDKKAAALKALHSVFHKDEDDGHFYASLRDDVPFDDIVAIIEAPLIETTDRAPPTGCEACDDFGRVEMFPDDDPRYAGDLTHPCDDCQPEASKHYRDGFQHAERLATPLAQAIESVIDGTFWTVKKNDKCPHGQYGYEGCEVCTANYLSEKLAAYRKPAGAA